MKTLPLLLAVSLSLAAPALSADKALTEEQRIVHVLNRLGFGPRPGDLERVKAQGLSAYIQQQLHPETLPDTTVEAKAATFDGLAIPPRTLDRLEAQSRQKGKALRKQLQRKATEAGQESSKKALRQQLTEKQRQELEQAAQAKKQVAEATQQVVANKFLRAIESEKQLQEVLVDFWSNHFNIDASKVRTAKIADEQRVIRPHVLGKFSELLNASAHSAAMMLYLDNDQSTAATPAKGKAKTKKKPGGLNENYAREVMELHTLGVDGGYTQKDVTELARCLTGWGVEKGKYSSVFAYHDNLHDKKPKEVLGLRLPAGGGQEDGQAVLDLLARHPSTMRHISTQLCQRFVADNPPASLVEKCVATWKRTDGDIREILTTIFTSPEFNSASAFKSKVKSPFEYVVSAARALGASYEVGPKPQESFGKKTPTGKETLTSGQVALLGQPLFRYAFPTGYPEESSKWVSSGALIGRINFALRLTEGKLDDLKVPSLAPLSPEKPQTLALRLLGQPLSPATAATLQKQGVTGTKAVALLLGSPEFQRR
ncbi:DUF1800 domain-containing protein [Armatimonas rosea]|uniref:Uncharacterized protein (DUF1800 family) n=1 Tax=Armatimonas rosea TaxID=685828 RepID=A0A7W9SNH6_ARMRO|nr:DUF1800 domain-containing protein [Armatimonas rosea]MBB6049880.1 uncharacterized protein (DUF1800 family) [Armatimonas rosea]